MRAPRILVTGFGPFPGAPVNPTATLVAELNHDPPATGEGAFRAAVLSVEYDTIADQLSALSSGFSPDIAIHFGLAARCAGFRLERIARNSHAEARPDRAGRLPASMRVCEGPDSLPSTLPLAPIARRLEDGGLPVEWSDDAGGYLCNAVMALSLAHASPGLTPSMAGFIHVPPFPVDRASGLGHMRRETLLAGARLIIGTCADHWQERQP